MFSRMVSKIVYFDQDKLNGSIVCTRIEASNKASVVNFDNEVKAMRYVIQDTEVRVILLRVPEGRITLVPILQKLAALERQFVILYTCEDHEIEDGEFNNMIQLKRLDSFNDAELGPSLREFGVFKKEDNAENFKKVRVYELMQFNTIACDIFLKINDEKFVKIINKDELFSMEILSKFYNKKIEYLYVRSDEMEQYLNDMNENMMILYDNEFVSDKLKLETQLASVDLIHKYVNSLGLSEASVELARRTVQSVMSSFSKQEKLWDLLKSKFGKNNYFCEHSLVLCYLTSAVSKKMTWSSETTLKKLVMACLLHDIGLQDEELAIVNNKNSNEFEELDELQKDDVIKHPLRTVQLLSNFSQLPANVESIILEHHERPDGTGFPKGKRSSGLSSMSAIFIVCEEFWNRLSRRGISSENKKEVIDELIHSYSEHKKFKNVLEGLIEVVS